MKNARWFIILFWLAGMWLAGCSRAPVTHITTEENVSLEESGMTLEEFTRTYRLTRTATTADRYEFDADGQTLVIFTNLSAINFAGQAYSLPLKPQWRQGRLFLPQTFLDALPAVLRERPRTPEPPAAVKVIRPRLVIIDAGHGGHDEGASAHGLREKDLNLDIALRLRKKLTEQGVATQMTRDRDVFLTLEERSRLANRHSGAVFVSIHQNAARDASVSGVETFWISGEVNDDLRARTAARRYTFISPSGRLNRADATRKAKEIAARMRRASQTLAATVQHHLIRALGENDRGVKQANFAVLRNNFFGTVVLVETGFLTHPTTARRMTRPEYRQKIADCLAVSVTAFLSSNQ